MVRRSCRQNGSLECTRPYDDVAYAAACASIVIASPIQPTAIHWAMPYHAIEVRPLSLNGLRLPSSSKRSMRLSRRIRTPLWCRIRSQPSSHDCLQVERRQQSVYFGSAARSFGLSRVRGRTNVKSSHAGCTQSALNIVCPPADGCLPSDNPGMLWLMRNNVTLNSTRCCYGDQDGTRPTTKPINDTCDAHERRRCRVMRYAQAVNTSACARRLNGCSLRGGLQNGT